jgi:hypothetical protein
VSAVIADVSSVLETEKADATMDVQVSYNWTKNIAQELNCNFEIQSPTEKFLKATAWVKISDENTSGDTHLDLAKQSKTNAKIRATCLGDDISYTSKWEKLF